ncbi:MAG: sigma-70 family RNA polymerase sigma factor [Crocinitomicaceae bacterium]
MLTVSEKLISKCIQKDRRAQKELYEICFHMLMPICFKYHKDEENARAALNMAFLKVVTKLDTLGESVPFEAWAKRITLNVIIDDFRKNKKYKEKVATKETDRELDYHTTTSSQNESVTTFEMEKLKGFIDKLPEISRKVFDLYIVQGYSHKEIGEILDISNGTSKWHLSNARKILREMITEQEHAELSRSFG